MTKLGDAFLRISEKQEFARRLFSSVQFQLLTIQVLKGTFNEDLGNTHWNDLLKRIGIFDTVDDLHRLKFWLRDEPVSTCSETEEGEECDLGFLLGKRKVPEDVDGVNFDHLDAMLKKLQLNQRNLMKKLRGFEVNLCSRMLFEC